MTIGWVPASFAARSSANSPIRWSPTERLNAHALAQLFTERPLHATVVRQVKQPRRPIGPSRKLRTSQGKVVELSTRGNPRESATETNRRCRPSHVNGWQARVKWCGKSAPAPR
jgi:hypothetical protein